MLVFHFIWLQMWSCDWGDIADENYCLTMWCFNFALNVECDFEMFCQRWTEAKNWEAEQRTSHLSAHSDRNMRLCDSEATWKKLWQILLRTQCTLDGKLWPWRVFHLLFIFLGDEKSSVTRGFDVFSHFTGQRNITTLFSLILGELPPNKALKSHLHRQPHTQCVRL